MKSIPHIDMSRYETDFATFAQDVGEGYERNGFVALTNHGISPDIIHGALDISRELFALPAQIKQQYHQPGRAAPGVIRRLEPKLRKTPSMWT